VNPVDELSRFWNDLVERAADDAAAAANVDPALIEAVRRFQALDTGPSPDPDFVRDLRAALVGEPQTGRFGPNGSALVGPATMPTTVRPLQPSAPRVIRPKRWWPPLEFAAAALLILGLFGAYFGGYRALPAIFGEREDAAGDGPSLLVDVTVPGELIENLITGWISKVTIAPGEQLSRLPRPGAGEGFAVEYVVEGTYTVVANGAVTVLRESGGDTPASEDVEPGVEVTLETGDAIVYRDPRQGGSAANGGSTSVVLISFGSVEGDFLADVGPPALAGVARTSGPVAFQELGGFGAPTTSAGPGFYNHERGWPTPVPAQVGFRLWEATVAPGQTLANPVPGTFVTFAKDTEGAPSLEYGDENNSVTNVDDAPVHLVILTVGPFGVAGEPPY
jgi:hypothetical protein